MVLLAPDNAVGYRNVGNAHFLLQHYEDAISTWLRSLKIEPDYRVYSNMATLYYRFQNYTEAARMYERALAFQDTHYLVWGNLATAYYWAEGERHKAPGAWRHQIEAAEVQLAVNPRDLMLLNSLARSYAHLGDREQALALLQRMIVEEPEEPGPLALIGFMYEILNERARALEWLTKSLNSGSRPEDFERDPWLRALRADPDYLRLLSREGSPAG